MLYYMDVPNNFCGIVPFVYILSIALEHNDLFFDIISFVYILTIALFGTQWQFL